MHNEQDIEISKEPSLQAMYYKSTVSASIILIFLVTLYKETIYIPGQTNLPNTSLVVVTRRRRSHFIHFGNP